MPKALDRQSPALFTGLSHPASQGDICTWFLACVSVEEACHLTKDWLKRQFPELSGDISLFSEDHEYLETVVSWSEQCSKGDSFRHSNCWAIRRGRPHHFGAGSESGIAPCQHYEADGEDWHLCLPLMASGEALGLIHLHRPGTPEEGTADGMVENGQQDCDLDGISESLSMAISSLNLRKTLQDQAIRDPLTQLFNRRYLEYTLQRELYQAERAKVPLAIAIMDVDHFKKFNDEFGHDAGDVLLKNVGAVLLKHMRGGDIACRFGGEEFALVYPGMPKEVAIARLETIREQIGKLSLSHRGIALDPVTISAGIAVYPEHGGDIENLINSADQALYRSKESGRNQVTIWHNEGEEERDSVPLKLVHDGDAACAEGGKF